MDMLYLERQKKHFMCKNNISDYYFEVCKIIISGVNIRWITEPPSTVKVGEDFTTVTELILTNKFYEWAVGPGYQFFTTANNSVGITNAVDAQNWCETTTCPLGTASTAETCCIHHMNVHSCPLTSNLQNNLCGPWISPQGDVYTHSTVIVGHALQGNWTNNIAGLYVEGDTSLIAHFKVALMQIALYFIVVCGDSKCETSEGETCSVCPADCGRCPLKAWEIALIVVFAALILFVLLGVLVYIRYQKRKMLLDESWIYQYEDISEGTSGGLNVERSSKLK
ncbi:hypothetical protein KUTeg_016447 [Tegillarca granosa]|uniref:Uncharacterized protein n=1 Tax=Tegillarca granosa TaxID=220873 RepID=A0ABQ9EKW7_TEGGR|nr:hypothetical protein KUTeg_016447 [Tegillarca granosa]